MNTNLLTRPAALAATLLLVACDAADTPAPAVDPQTAAPVTASPGDTRSPDPIHPENWPRQAAPLERDPAVERRIEDLMARMTLAEKVGQVIQADIASVTPEEVRDYHLGSVLNGGGSAPGGDLRAEPQAWLDLADAFWDASTDTSDGGLGIPAIWGTDAVHGHGNIVGATIFPHNIGLGAANDPDLMERIGEVTALEMLATGLDWTFAPTIAVVRNDRWGRTYESYSEDPRIVVAFAPRIVTGLQGHPGTPEFLRDGHMIATAKHFVGDGGTVDGHDQGDNVDTEAELRDIHAAGYPPAIAAGVQSVMASFNSFHGRKMHGYETMLDDVLVDRLGLDGFVVGDWNGHGQVSGCSNVSCAQSFNAGLDMFMAPDSWKGLYENTLAQVRNGEIDTARLDEAVARILRVKLRAGVFEAGRPSSRPRAGDFDLLGAPAHRAVAREAVRKSLVLLKNDGVLPIAADARVLLVGDGAHDIGKQSGGWTLSWQGTGNENHHFPNGASIFDGFREALEAAGGRAVLAEDGEWSERPDVAVVVFGEDPYAEGFGDRPHVDYVPHDGLEWLRALRKGGIPTVAVFLSGRPLYVNPELNAADAFVAAWLPGTEGGGIADVLVAGADGEPRHDFVGRLSFSWPRHPSQAELNVGDEDYDPLFAYGYGLGYGDDGALAPLPEDADTEDTDPGLVMAYGDPLGGWTFALQDEQGLVDVQDSRATSATGRLRAEPRDDEVQEDSLLLEWSGAAAFIVSGPAQDLSDRPGSALEIVWNVLDAGDATVSVRMFDSHFRSGGIDLTPASRAVEGEGWQTRLIGLSCFTGDGLDLSSVSTPVALMSDGPYRIMLKSIRVVDSAADVDCD